MSKFGNLLCVLCLTAMGFAQTQLATPTPSLPQDKKMATLEKQHALDKVEGQIKDLTLQFQQLQAQAQGQLTQLTERQKKAKADLDAQYADDQSGIDPKLWKFDAENLDHPFTAVPTPAAPANAATQPPAKPSPSPGAATPPIEQAKK